MYDIRVCVGCLASEVRMFNMGSSGLLQAYQLLSGVQYNMEVTDMPNKLCWECAALVHKFRSFRRKCVTAHALLRDIYVEHCQVSDEIVKTIDRRKHGLHSSYSIERLDTKEFFKFKHKKPTKKSKIKKKSPTLTKISRDVEAESEMEESVVKVEPLIQIDVKKEEDDEIKMEFEEDRQASDSDYAEAELAGLIEDEPAEMKEDTEMPLVEVIEPEPVVLRRKTIVRVSKVEKKKKKKHHVPKKAGRKGIDAKDFGMIEETMTQEEQHQVYQDRQKTDGYLTARFPCHRCYRPFNEERTFNNHMLLHDPVSGELECDICRLRYPTRNHMHKHMSNTHIKKYTCVKCEQVFYNRTSAQKHYAWHNGVIYTCEICCAIFTKKTTHRSHMRIKHSSGHVCSDCGEQFVSDKGLQQHIKMIHLLKKDVGANVATGPYCAVCSVQFSSQQAWTRHVLISPKHTEDRGRIANACPLCGASFLSAEQLKEHKRLEHPPKQQRPKLSDEQREWEYEQMKRTSGVGGSGPYCEACCVQFSSQQAWTRHVLISPKHAHERHLYSLACAECGEETSDPESLKRHRAAHARRRLLGHDQPITCEQCGQPQESSRAYHDHFRRAHPDKTRTFYPAMRAPIMCELCGKMFQKKCHLKLHTYTHTGEKPFKCDICGKLFGTPKALSLHIRSHTKEQPYKCDVCGMGFSYASNLNRHRRVHSDAKPYPCETCGKFFKCKATAKSHFEFVHMKRPWPRRDGGGRRLIANTPHESPL